MNIDLANTLNFYKVLQNAAAADASVFTAIPSILAKHNIAHESGGTIRSVVSPILLEKSEFDRLSNHTKTIFSMVEKAIDFLMDDRQRLNSLMPEHERFFEFLCKTPGNFFWQGVSRYDLVLSQDGQLKIIEINACCPGGFLFGDTFTKILEAPLQQVNLRNRISKFCNLDTELLLAEMLKVEKAAQFHPATIAILYDEAGLSLELDLFAKAFTNRGRQCLVSHAEDLQLTNGSLTLHGKLISMTYNKFWPSTPNSPFHCWQPGFETRYGALLEAMQKEKVVSINNLGAAIVGEGKSLLALFFDQEFKSTLTNEEVTLINDMFLWTKPLRQGPVKIAGHTTDLVDYVAKAKDKLVIKPAHESRGYMVAIGKHTPKKNWNELIEKASTIPLVVQEYLEPARLPMLIAGDKAVKEDTMAPTLSLGCVFGKPAGILSRATIGAVGNYAQQGFMQPVAYCELR